MQAYIERFEGTSVKTDERVIGSAADAVSAVDMLDGRDVTSVSFEPPAGPKLMLSGGPGGYLASTWDDESEESWIAQEPGDATPGEVEVVSAGQRVSVPAAQVLSRQRIDAIVAQFVADQGRASEAEWKRD